MGYKCLDFDEGIAMSSHTLFATYCLCSHDKTFISWPSHSYVKGCPSECANIPRYLHYML